MGDNGAARDWAGNFEAVTAEKFRLNIVAGVDPTVYEFELYKPEETQTVETDKSKLQEAITEAEAAIADGDVDVAGEEVRESFMAVYNYAVAVNNNEASSQDTIDRTYSALMEELQKISSSKPVSKKTLEYFLNRAKTLVENGSVAGCVESIQKLFEEAIAEGEAVMADENATREEVTNATAKLMLAVQAVDMKAGDKTDLEMAVELGDMIDLTKYVEEGQAEFTEALVKAKEVLADGDAFQEDVDSAWNALVDAISNLRLKADKSVLEDLISQVGSLDLTGYTEESVSVFRAALAAANDILADETLSENDQAKVDEAAAALQAAYDGLEKAQGGEPENPGGGDQEKPQNPDGDNGNQGETSGGNGSGSGTDNGNQNSTANGQNGGSSAGTGSKAAKTGDAAPIAAAGLMAALSAGAVLLVTRKRAGK